MSARPEQVPYCRRFDILTCADPSLATEVGDEFSKRKLPAHAGIQRVTAMT